MTGEEQQFKYPDARRQEDVQDSFFNESIKDPYRWLEDPDAEDTKAFVDAQNGVTVPYLAKCDFREKMTARLTELWDYPKYGCPFKEGQRYFYFFNSGLQNQSVLLVQDSLQGEAKVFFDPNTLSDDGTVALGSFAFSEDGATFAYMLSKSGSDWRSLHFRDVASGKDLPDVLERVKFSCLSWTHDHLGVFYNHYPEPVAVAEGAEKKQDDGTETAQNLNQKLKYHRLGQSQAEDRLCFEVPEHPKWMLRAEVTECGRFAVLTISESCKPANHLYVCDLQSTEPLGVGQNTGPLQYTKIVENFDSEYTYIINEGTRFTIQTNHMAPRYRLLCIDVANPLEANWQEVLPEHPHNVLDWCTCVAAEQLVLCYLVDAHEVLVRAQLATPTQQTNLCAEVGSVTGFSGKQRLHEFFYRFQSFLTPGVIYHCTVERGSAGSDSQTVSVESKVFREIKMPGFDPANFRISQEFFESRDGTRVPMFLVEPVAQERNANRPALLYGYGGFNISLTPNFSVSRLLWLQHFGGVWALANIRGGGEYGREWHEAGALLHKQNCFDDFQAAARHLVKIGVTNASRLAIQGGSNGGLLVAACINQAPELFGAAICQVGVLDMLRFHKFTIGHAWTSDFGCADTNEEQFRALLAYSPLHNVRCPDAAAQQYPALLLTTADHDDRVVPLHSLKFAAALQRAAGRSVHQHRPLLLRVDTKSGHGAGKPTAKVIEEQVDMLSFLSVALQLAWQ